MTAKEYNKSQWDNITCDMVYEICKNGGVGFTEKVKQLQYAYGLAADGRLGPKTQAKLAESLKPDFTEALIAEAKTHVGCGEEKSNNSGPFIDQMLRELNWTWLKEPLWCAVFVSFVINRVTHNSASLSPSVERLSGFLLNSWRAKPVYEMKRGDILIFSRGKLTFGHTGFCLFPPNTQGEYTTIEGNVGKFPAKVKIFRKDIVTQPPVKILRLEY